MNIYRGDIYYIENSKYFSVEYQSGTGARPAIIVSNDLCNQNSDECTVVYLTRTDDAPHIPTHVPVICKVPSIAKCETVCRINQNRIGEFIRALTKAEMEAIDKALMIQLGIEMPAAPEADAKAMEALKAELENAKIALASAIETNGLMLKERDELRAELNAEKAISDKYARENVEQKELRRDLESKLNEYRTTENTKIKELDALLEAEKSTSLLYKAQLDAQDAANEELRKMLTEAETKMDVMTAAREQEAEELEDEQEVVDLTPTEVRMLIETQDENIRLKAEIDVYKGMIGKLIPQLA